MTPQPQAACDPASLDAVKLVQRPKGDGQADRDPAEYGSPHSAKGGVFALHAPARKHEAIDPDKSCRTANATMNLSTQHVSNPLAVASGACGHKSTRALGAPQSSSGALRRQDFAAS